MGLFKKKTDNEKLKKSMWKVLIVDDEPDVHTVTKISLSRFEFDNKGIEFISAYSAEKAQSILATQKDIALIFLDVVMESDDAGLQVVRYIREQLNNHLVRIILRTGQPGQAPERDVIVEYDINDYKEKTSLSSDKLFTTTLTGLRSYRDILEIEQARVKLENHRVGLEKVIDSTSNLFRIRSLQKFASGLLEQISTLLPSGDKTQQSTHYAARKVNGQYEVLALSSVENSVPLNYTLPDNVLTLFDKACSSQSSFLEGNTFIGYFPTANVGENLIYLENVGLIGPIDKQLLEIFSNNITVAFENLELDKEIFETQCEIIETLGEVVESRSKEAANHVKRVAHLSRALASWSGLSDADAHELFMASPMHDVGKVAIPDSILLKPGKLNDEEWAIMKSHVSIGYEIFARSKRPVLQAAAIVAGQHHERFDGSGYPNGLVGEEIHIYGRIVALVDVFDALSHARCYKEAWEQSKVLELLCAEKGKHFDPNLVNLFIEHIEEVNHIMTSYPD